MFSINLPFPPHTEISRLPLHSTMFSINQAVRRSLTAAQPSLHSTMFSINLVRQSRGCTGISALHSTMFSINHGVNLFTFLIEVLYIPLCFLLISPSGRADGNSCDLYIPLCFLLIEYETQEAVACERFTFHYVFY